MTYLPIPRVDLPDESTLTKVLSADPDQYGYAQAVLPLKGSSHGSMIVNDKCFIQRYSPREPTALMISSHSYTQLDVDWNNFILRVNPKMSHLKWVARPYSMTGRVGKAILQNAPTEHIWYMSQGPGDFEMYDILARDASGQAFQQRLALADDGSPPEYNPYWLTPKTLRLTRFLAIECCQSSSRGGFSISPKSVGPTSSVHLKECFIQTVHQTNVDGKGHDSMGGFCLEESEDAILEGCTVELKNPANGSIQAYSYTKPSEKQRNPQNLVVHDGLYIGGGAVDVRIDQTRTVDISNCRGDGIIRLWHADVPNNKFVEVPHGRIPIAQGYKQ